jgi:hypothetical protein
MSYGVRQIIDPNDADRVLDVIRNFTFDMDHLIFYEYKIQSGQDDLQESSSRVFHVGTSGECQTSKSI